MSWRRVLKSAQALAAHSLLLCFSLLLLFKLDHRILYSWWAIFSPLWVFDAVVARERFSLPAPSVPHNRQWAPCHAIVALPLLIAFELLLCIYLESAHDHGFRAVSLKIVFLPLLAFEIIILIDNFRMCRALMPGDDNSMSDEAIWDALPHFWISISMIFFVAATVFTLLKLCGDIGALGWWDLFINFGIAECFAFLVCKRWSNPLIHRTSRAREVGPSSATIRYNNLVVSPEEDQHRDRMCALQDIGGHVMKVLGTPASAKQMSLPVIISPLLLLQVVGVLSAMSKLIEEIVILLRTGAGGGIYFRYSSKVHDCLGFLHQGSRLLGWWSIDEGSREELARLYYEGASGYSTFYGYPPEIVRKMPKKDLAEEVWRLQAALGEQTEITKYSQEKFERIQNEKVLCRVCFEREISVVLLPCRHRVLCSICCDKCKKCPICRVYVEERLPVYDV